MEQFAGGLDGAGLCTFTMASNLSSLNFIQALEWEYECEGFGVYSGMR